MPFFPITTAGVASFNGRTGAVVPASGDYAASYDALGAAVAASGLPALVAPPVAANWSTALGAALVAAGSAAVAWDLNAATWGRAWITTPTLAATGSMIARVIPTTNNNAGQIAGLMLYNPTTTEWYMVGMTSNYAASTYGAAGVNTGAQVSPSGHVIGVANFFGPLFLKLEWDATGVTAGWSQDGITFPLVTPRVTWAVAFPSGHASLTPGIIGIGTGAIPLRMTLQSLLIQ